MPEYRAASPAAASRCHPRHRLTVNKKCYAPVPYNVTANTFQYTDSTTSPRHKRTLDICNLLRIHWIRLTLQSQSVRRNGRACSLAWFWTCSRMDRISEQYSLFTSNLGSRSLSNTPKRRRRNHENSTDTQTGVRTEASPPQSVCSPD